jgi:yersiniabactin nonribosomal peptide synthetase
VKTLPRTPTGKIDRQALSGLEVKVNSMDSTVVRAPIDPVELAIAEIWSVVLGINVTEIAAEDDFFSLGGNSIEAVRMVTLLQQKLGTRLCLGSVYERPTVAELACYLQPTSTGKKCSGREGAAKIDGFQAQGSQKLDAELSSFRN